MDSSELTEWMAYYDLEPWGSTVDGLRDSLLCATVANSGLMASNPKQLKRKPFNSNDFVVGIDPDIYKSFSPSSGAFSKDPLETSFQKLKGLAVPARKET